MFKKLLIISIFIGSCFLLPLRLHAEESCDQILDECKGEAQNDLKKCIENSNVIIDVFELECEMEGNKRSTKNFRTALKSYNPIIGKDAQKLLDMNGIYVKEFTKPAKR